ncbi:MAG: RAMP superfamily CRISPR-associated protein [Clostridia bacterium]|nr:RAMP superfamily CRISPR-associated protein [Clostridia bacterium]
MAEVIKKKYKVSIQLKTPLHISSGVGGEKYRTMLLLENRPIIPASTIKGELRSNFTKLLGLQCTGRKEAGQECSCAACEIFGGAGYKPARIYIQDFFLQEDGDTKDKHKFSIRPTVAIDRYRRVAKDGALAGTQILEKGVFKGSIEVYFTHETYEHEKFIRIGLKMIEAIGGGKSRGLGFVKVEVEDCE